MEWSTNQNANKRKASEIASVLKMVFTMQSNDDNNKQCIYPKQHFYFLVGPDNSSNSLLLSQARNSYH